MTSLAKIDAIVRIVADRSGSTPELIMGRDRTPRVAIPRHVAQHLVCAHVPNWSKSRVARHWGRDHTTILFALKAMQNRADRTRMRLLARCLWPVEQAMREIDRYGSAILFALPAPDVPRITDMPKRVRSCTGSGYVDGEGNIVCHP